MSLNHGNSSNEWHSLMRASRTLTDQLASLSLDKSGSNFNSSTTSFKNKSNRSETRNPLQSIQNREDVNSNTCLSAELGRRFHQELDRQLNKVIPVHNRKRCYSGSIAEELSRCPSTGVQDDCKARHNQSTVNSRCENSCHNSHSLQIAPGVKINHQNPTNHQSQAIHPAAVLPNSPILSPIILMAPTTQSSSRLVSSTTTYAGQFPDSNPVHHQIIYNKPSTAYPESVPPVHSSTIPLPVHHIHLDKQLLKNFSSNQRCVAKNGVANIHNAKISRKNQRFFLDTFTTMIDIDWHYNLLVFALSFVLSWLFFAVIWWLIAYQNGDLPYLNNNENVLLDFNKISNLNVNFLSDNLDQIKSQIEYPKVKRSLNLEQPNSTLQLLQPYKNHTNVTFFDNQPIMFWLTDLLLNQSISISNISKEFNLKELKFDQDNYLLATHDLDISNLSTFLLVIQKDPIFKSKLKNHNYSLDSILMLFDNSESSLSENRAHYISNQKPTLGFRSDYSKLLGKNLTQNEKHQLQNLFQLMQLQNLLLQDKHKQKIENYFQTQKVFDQQQSFNPVHRPLHPPPHPIANDFTESMSKQPLNSSRLTGKNRKSCLDNINSFGDALLFSIETQHTIGYGTRQPTDECQIVFIVIMLQSITGCLIQCFVVGFVFAKLSRPQNRHQTLIFSKNAVINMTDQVKKLEKTSEQQIDGNLDELIELMKMMKKGEQLNTDHIEDGLGENDTLLTDQNNYAKMNSNYKFKSSANLQSYPEIIINDCISNEQIFKGDKQFKLEFRIGDVREKSHIINAKISAFFLRKENVLLKNEILNKNHKIKNQLRLRKSKNNLNCDNNFNSDYQNRNYNTNQLLIDKKLYKFTQAKLPLTIDNAQNSDGELLLIWPIVVSHNIDQNSPLWSVSKDEIKNLKFEIVIVLEGTIESTGQSVQARTSYLPNEILWGEQFVPLLQTDHESSEFLVNFSLFNVTKRELTPEYSAKEFFLRKKIYQLYNLKAQLDKQKSSSDQNNSTDINYNQTKGQNRNIDKLIDTRNNAKSDYNNLFNSQIKNSNFIDNLQNASKDQIPLIMQNLINNFNQTKSYDQVASATDSGLSIHHYSSNNTSNKIFSKKSSGNLDTNSSLNKLLELFNQKQPGNFDEISKKKNKLSSADNIDEFYEKTKQIKPVSNNHKFGISEPFLNQPHFLPDLNLSTSSKLMPVSNNSDYKKTKNVMDTTLYNETIHAYTVGPTFGYSAKHLHGNQIDQHQNHLSNYLKRNSPRRSVIEPPSDNYCMKSRFMTSPCNDK